MRNKAHFWIGILMKQYIVDAFTDKLFKGNQAAVCVMEKWIPDDLMQNIAIENNFSETAFTVKNSVPNRLSCKASGLARLKIEVTPFIMVPRMFFEVN